MSKFEKTYCSQCGNAFGPGDHGFSHCKNHKGKRSLTSREESEALADEQLSQMPRRKPRGGSAMTLENCPFCGGNARRQDLTDEGNKGGSCIACDQCGASSPVHFDRKENLYDSWNRRAPKAAPTPAGEEGEACECIKCGRLHQPLGKPPWALSHDDLMRLSRQFLTDYRTAQDQRINDWLKRLIAEATP